MPKRRMVDASKVIEAVKSGRLSKDTLDSYGLNSKPPDASKSTGRRGRKRAAEIPASDYEYRDIQVNKRGSLVLPKALLDALDVDPDGAFAARKTKSGIVLRKV